MARIYRPSRWGSGKEAERPPGMEEATFDRLKGAEGPIYLVDDRTHSLEERVQEYLGQLAPGEELTPWGSILIFAPNVMGMDLYNGRQVNRRTNLSPREDLLVHIIDSGDPWQEERIRWHHTLAWFLNSGSTETLADYVGNPANDLEGKFNRGDFPTRIDRRGRTVSAYESHDYYDTVLSDLLQWTPRMPEQLQRLTPGQMRTLLTRYGHFQSGLTGTRLLRAQEEALDRLFPTSPQAVSSPPVPGNLLGAAGEWARTTLAGNTRGVAMVEDLLAEWEDRSSIWWRSSTPTASEAEILRGLEKAAPSLEPWELMALAMVVVHDRAWAKDGVSASMATAARILGVAEMGFLRAWAQEYVEPTTDLPTVNRWETFLDSHDADAFNGLDWENMDFPTDLVGLGLLRVHRPPKSSRPRHREVLRMLRDAAQGH